MTRRQRERMPPADLKLMEVVRWAAFELDLHGPLSKQLARIAQLEPGQWTAEEVILVRLVLACAIPTALLIDAKRLGSAAQDAEWVYRLAKLGMPQKRAILEVIGTSDPRRFKAVSKALERQRKRQKARQVSPSATGQRRRT